MAEDTNAMTDGSTRNHPAADVEAIVVDPEDVIESMKRNHRDQDEQRTHVLRISPAFKGEKEATPHVSEAHTYYPRELSQKPLHVDPEAFIVGHAAGSRHPDWQRHLAHPSISEARSIFRDDFNGYDDDGEPLPISENEELESQWEEFWDITLNEWESNVRHALAQTDELTLETQHPEIDATTVEVRFESQE